MQVSFYSANAYIFLSALENGKETVQLNKVLQVTACLGIEIHAQPRGWKARDTQA
ncbi:hypothetical protein [uncultured Desulfuromusa sp.]|uniref:hypothetical protein n=1 Tax=uncultured Desulfuromusa sp. TaxID=219183 RepID=UPI002AA5E66C|nr:hypothetical protein [uncultured Desulfuromusa sp.]